MSYTIGPVQRTPPPPPDTADTLHGSGWKASRRAGGCVLDYDSGELVARDKSLDITPEEFERLRADKEQFLPIVRAHGG